jgi:heat shock protein HtpX
MTKRVMLFLLTNILIMFTISIILQVLGIGRYLTRYGMDYQSLALICLVWGMGGAFISLAISRIMAKMALGVRVIDPDQASGDERWLVETVHGLARKLEIGTMPQVGIYESPQPNAFATGPTRNRALVAVSTGILERMSRPELEGVLGHEMSHVANGDMVTMTLVQGVINAFVMFLARALAFVISQAMRGDRESRGGGGMNFLLVIVLQMVLGFLGMLVVNAFSRFREFGADRGSADLVGKSKMIAALRALGDGAKIKDPEPAPALAAFKISGDGSSLLSTHPSLEARIARLQEAQIN